MCIAGRPHHRRPRFPQVLPVYPSSLATATNMVLDDDVTQCGLVLADADLGPQSFEQQEQTMLIALKLGAQNTPPDAQQQHLAATTTIDLSDGAQNDVQVVSGLGHRVNMVLPCPGCTAPRCGARRGGRAVLEGEGGCRRGSTAVARAGTGGWKAVSAVSVAVLAVLACHT